MYGDLIRDSLALLISGCTSTNQITLAEYQIDPTIKHPPVTVFNKRPSETFQQSCAEFDQQSVLHHCRINLHDLSKLRLVLSESEAFEQVLFANDEVDYRLLLTTAMKNHEGGDELGQAVIAGATLMLAPMKMSAEIEVEGGLYWHNQLIYPFNYKLPFEQNISLLTMDQDTDKDIAASIGSHILRDIQKNDLFSGELLIQKLEASNYYSDLHMPQALNGYTLDNQHIYRHPFLGSQSRYFHPDLMGDFIDVFVYPIRKPAWEDFQEILKKEAGNIHRDIELMQKEAQYTNLKLEETQLISWKTEQAKRELAFFSGTFEDKLSNPMHTTTYLTIIADKFVKIRSTGVNNADTKKSIDVFVNQLLSEIRVPEESLFMARIRKQWRDKGLL